MKRLLFALCLVLTLGACQQLSFKKLKELTLGQQSLKNKKYYVLNARGFYVEEIELDFITEDKLKATITIYAGLYGMKNIKTHPELVKQSTIIAYTWKDGFLGIPPFNFYVKLEPTENGDLISQSKEVLYKTSALDYPGMTKFKERIKVYADDKETEKFLIGLVEYPSRKSSNQYNKPFSPPVKMNDVVVPDAPQISEVPQIPDNETIISEEQEEAEQP
ncbi:hypothetical protein [Chitinophaga sp. RAB17]|uniref:hypothetical protein n=1 Tax=Chitinophaga sp. RAB17 TaxID=3233049 RepID=UPI003F909463